MYSYVRAHIAIPPLEADEVPVTFATVELDEGCRLVARIGGTEAPTIGERVAAVFVDRGSWTELAFGLVEPAESAAAPNLSVSAGG